MNGVLGACALGFTCLALASMAASPPPLYRDVTAESGLRFRHHNGADGRRFLPETMGGGGCVLDFDLDGRMDVFLVDSGKLGGAPEPAFSHRLFRNLGAFRFEDVTAKAHLESRPEAYGQGAVCADYDGDGDTDIYVTALGANQLWRNDGKGSFAEVAAAAGVADPAWSSSATFFDADGDGDLDLYVVNYLDWTLVKHKPCRHAAAGVELYCHPDVYPPAIDHFYRNGGDGHFEEVGAAAGLIDSGGKGLGVLAGDFDGDGWQDLYVSNDSTPNFYFHGLGQGRFEEIGLIAGAAVNAEGRTEAGMGIASADFDGDLRPDLVVTNLSLEANALYLGRGAEFQHFSRQAGLYGPSYKVLGFGISATDFDFDGDQDLLVTNGDVLDNVELLNDGLSFRQPGQAFRNDGKAHFVELAAHELGDPATPRVGRGSMLGDFDDNGAFDLVVSYNNDEARLYRHSREPGEAGNFIGFDLRGRAPNTRAIGARVSIEVDSRRQMAEVRAGSSYQTSSDPRLVFGIGKATKVDVVEIRWPDGQLTRLEGLEKGRYHRIEQPAVSSGPRK